MGRKIWLVIAAGYCLASPALAATAAGSDAGTVNSYTPAQAARALKAATNAGFGAPAIVDAQAGAFFMTASKNGSTYQLTVTPDGKVYPGTPQSK